MKRLLNSIFTFVLLVVSIIIFCVTLYFCLDVFEIIEVPEKYSLVSLFHSKIEVMVPTEDIVSNIIEEEVLKQPSPRVVVEHANNSETAVDSEFWNELEEKLKTQEKVEMEGDTTPQNFYYEQLQLLHIVPLPL